MMLSFLNWDNIQRHHQAWVLSSAGRASPLQGECRRFDPVSTHHSIFFCKTVHRLFHLFVIKFKV